MYGSAYIVNVAEFSFYNLVLLLNQAILGNQVPHYQFIVKALLRLLPCYFPWYLGVFFSKNAAIASR
jgi:hypothetical protein